MNSSEAPKREAASTPPPVDSDGKIIGDLPWKFFNPEVRPREGSKR